MEPDNFGHFTKLEQFISEVMRFWHGAHLYFRIIKTDNPPSMNWHTVTIPENELSKPDDVLKSTIFHEWGHRTISPESPELSKIWQLIVFQTLSRLRIFGGPNYVGDDSSKVEDYSSKNEIPHTIINMITDLWVDDFYLSNSSTKDFYYKGLSYSIREARQRFQNDLAENALEKDSNGAQKGQRLFKLFIELYDILLQKSKGSKLVFPNDLSEKAYNILFDNQISARTKIVEFTSLVHNLFPLPVKLTSLIYIIGKVNNSSAQDYKTDKNKVIKLLKKYGIKASGFNLRSVFGVKEGLDLFIYINELSLYSQVIDTVESVHRKGTVKNEFVGFTRWRPGHKLTELETERSIERYGTIIPYFSTLKKNYMKMGRNNQNSGIANICLIADDSGSMSEGNTLERTQEALFSIILAAEKRNDLVSLIIFGSQVTYDMHPCDDYSLLKKAVASMEGESGGTLLKGAIVKAHKFSQEVEKQTTFIFTDTYIFEREEELKDDINALAANSKIVIFAFSENRKDALNFSHYFNYTPYVKIYYVEHGSHFYESSLKEIYNG